MNELNSLYRQLSDNILVCHNKNEIPFISVPHLHSQYEIYYNISGAKGFMLDGSFYKCKGCDLIVVPKICTHKAVVKKNVSYERCIINIDETVLYSIEAIYKNKESLSWLKGGIGMINLSEREHERFMELIKRYNECEKEKNELLMLGAFLNIMAYLTELFKNPQKTEYLSEEDISLADKIIYYVEKNFCDITVSDIASKLFMNEDYIRRLFKSETGITIKQYLIIRKLAEAKKYLYLKKSVKEACVLSGFNDYANFLRTFKKYEGYSPGELEELGEKI